MRENSEAGRPERIRRPAVVGPCSALGRKLHEVRTEIVLERPRRKLVRCRHCGETFWIGRNDVSRRSVRGGDA